MIANGKIFDVAVIAGENDRVLFEIEIRQRCTKKLCQGRKNAPRRVMVLRMANFVSDEVLVQCEPVRRCYSCQNTPGFCRCSQRCLLAALDQCGIGEVVKDGVSRDHVCDRIETKSCSLNRGGGRGDPSRTALKKPFRVGVGEGDLLNARVPELPEHLAQELVKIIGVLRGMQLKKLPSVAETIDWGRTVLALGMDTIDDEVIAATLGVVLKHQSDQVKAAGELRLN